VSFTEPYYAAQQAVTINQEKTPEVTSVDKLPSGSVIAVQTGTTGEKWIRENTPDGVEVRSFTEAPDTYTALEAGSVAAVIFDEPSAIAEAKKRKALKVVQVLDTGERYGFGVDPRNPELLKALNDALAEMKQDGTYDRIYKQFADLPPNGDITKADQ
jgi:ABC-type amino acid transport substrate-binding protein